MTEAESTVKGARPPAIGRSRHVERAGRAGVFMSIACAIHCLALPSLLVLGPSAGLVYFVGHGVELVFIGVMLTIALICSCWGFRLHRKKRLFLAFGGAAAFILIGEAVADDALKVALVMLGGFGLVLSHFLNLYLCRTCGHCQHDHA